MRVDFVSIVRPRDSLYAIDEDGRVGVHGMWVIAGSQAHGTSSERYIMTSHVLTL